MSTHEPGLDEEPLSYEEARNELIAVVQKLEGTDIRLDDALELAERGEILAQRCEELLAGARERHEASDPGAGA